MIKNCNMILKLLDSSSAQLADTQHKPRSTHLTITNTGIILRWCPVQGDRSFIEIVVYQGLEGSLRDACAVPPLSNYWEIRYRSQETPAAFYSSHNYQT